MRTLFEGDTIFVQTGITRMFNRILEFMFPPSACVLGEDLDWERFEVPQYHPDDPARPLGYYESGAKLL